MTTLDALARLRDLSELGLLHGRSDHDRGDHAHGTHGPHGTHGAHSAHGRGNCDRGNCDRGNCDRGNCDLGGCDQAARARLTDLARQVATLLSAPTCLVTAVLPDAVAILAGHGVDGVIGEIGGMPAEWAFCAAVCRTGEPMLVSDAATVPAAADNFLVQVEGLRAYLGVPVLSHYGNIIGALCITATDPRIFTAAEVATMQRFALGAAALIEVTRHTHPASDDAPAR